MEERRKQQEWEEVGWQHIRRKGKKAAKAEMETYLAMTDEEEEGGNAPGKLPAGD